MIEFYCCIIYFEIKENLCLNIFSAKLAMTRDKRYISGTDVSTNIILQFKRKFSAKLKGKRLKIKVKNECQSEIDQQFIGLKQLS